MTEHSTLDTTTLHQAVPGTVTETIISEERLDPDTPFAGTPTEFPPGSTAPSTEVIIESPDPVLPSHPTNAPLHDGAEPHFVPPPPAPPVEEGGVTMMSGKRPAKAESPRGITKPQSAPPAPKQPSPPAAKPTAPPTTPLVKEPANVPKRARSEWEMPVFNSRAVFSR